MPLSDVHSPKLRQLASPQNDQRGTHKLRWAAPRTSRATRGSPATRVSSWRHVCVLPRGLPGGAIAREDLFYAHGRADVRIIEFRASQRSDACRSRSRSETNPLTASHRQGHRITCLTVLHFRAKPVREHRYTRRHPVSDPPKFDKDETERAVHERRVKCGGMDTVLVSTFRWNAAAHRWLAVRSIPSRVGYPGAPKGPFNHLAFRAE
jgi:hypothetical protein